MRVLGLDVGGQRIGCAVSDPEGRIAFPAHTLRRSTPAEDVQAVLEVARRLGAEAIVVGFPLTLSGTPGSQAREVLAFVEALRQATPLPVETWDERLTTVQAERLLRESGRRPSREKERRDAAAAAVLLQAYLDARSRGERGCRPSG